MRLAQLGPASKAHVALKGLGWDSAEPSPDSGRGGGGLQRRVLGLTGLRFKF